MQQPSEEEIRARFEVYWPLFMGMYPIGTKKEDKYKLWRDGFLAGWNNPQAVFEPPTIDNPDKG